MKKDQFLQEVRHEINMLKKNATPEEINRLDLITFDYSKPRSCIYGQMTGNCESRRAKGLMDLSCGRVMELKEGVNDIADLTIDDDKFNINGGYTGQTWAESKWGLIRKYSYLSALEGYICTKGANIAGIMSYMKGEEDTLIL